MNFYQSTSKGLRACREARRERLTQRLHFGEQTEPKWPHRKPSHRSRLLHWHN